MLSDLQWRIIRLVAKLPEAEGFALAGGAALIAREAVDRRTKDVDFFATREEQVRRLQRGLIDAATASGLAVDPLETYPGFSRLLVNDGEQRCEVDLAYDARIQVAESMEYGDVLSLDELAADKVLALFARAEARDFIDVAALLPRYGWPRLCGLAAKGHRLSHRSASGRDQGLPAPSNQRVRPRRQRLPATTGRRARMDA